MRAGDGPSGWGLRDRCGCETCFAETAAHAEQERGICSREAARPYRDSYICADPHYGSGRGALQHGFTRD